MLELLYNLVGQFFFGGEGIYSTPKPASLGGTPPIGMEPSVAIISARISRTCWEALLV